ncbi:Hypothetical predicted protein [Mytilus galloprovincialis]|uniref:Reverse transcriptase domain-containing protein n=1 Tax=Mytilus galloprovincialis TaxID=29158 RepID=A0A8B6GNR6_MYTGA|nr:Hypothetical predicted protein [Mytilus galloprovincialis]
MQSPFQTAPLVEHATGLMRGEFVMELVDTPISAVSVSKVILSPTATRIKQQTDQMRMDRPEILKTQLTYNDLQLLQPNLNKCKLPTPIKTDRLKFHLQGYDSEKTLYLLNGFKNGFRLEHNGPRSQFNCSNLKSAKSNPLIVQEKINKEVNCQRVMGPYLEKPFLNLRVSPLGLVPKKSKSAWRLIHHLSYPDKKSNSVNAGISDESAAVHYAGIHEAINEIKQLRSHKYQVFLSKTDVRSAFRILPVNPSDYELLGFKWNNKFYYDCCLPMGCRTSCKIFEEFSTALEWIALTKLGITSMVHILDDFLIIEKSKEDAICKLKAFVNLCEDLGVPLSAEKTELPSQVMDFVGITLDVIKQEARLPPDKITKCRHLLEKFSHMKRCTLKELQSLIGVLNFACSVIQPGRAFLRRMINLTMTVSDGRTVFENIPSCSTQTVLSSTSIPATELLEYVTILANAALAPSTRATYSRAWKTFDSFCTEIMNQSLQPPLSVATISLFIAYMFKKSYAPSTISTYLSAIAYVHKMMSMPDNTQSFLVEKLVTGTYRLSKTFDSRLPITIPILNKLIQSITLVVKCTYDQVLFKAIFLFAFSTFSRVGELVTSKKCPK